MKIVSTNPGRNYEVIGEVEAASQTDVADAVAMARKAQPAWSDLSLQERCEKIRGFLRVCEDNLEDIAQTMSKEMGKPISSSRDSITQTFSEFEDYMQQAEAALAPSVVFENDTEKHIQTFEPRGVIAAITPWNFPFNNISFQIGQPLIAGNTVVMKPSEEIALFTQLISELVAKSDLPEGVLVPIVGDGAVGEMLVRQDVDMILFTGSTKTGQRITETVSEQSIPVLTEMGGSAPGIVFEDADVARTIDMLTMARFDNTGQLS